MNKRYNRLGVLTLWEGAGEGHHFGMTINDGFKKSVTDKIEEARLVKRERRIESSRRAVIKSLLERGLEVAGELSGYDENDIVGLVGEVMTDDFVTDLGLERILSKWRYTGTSKSSGIDLVARERPGDEWELALYEAKHLHNEVRNAGAELCKNIIRHKFKKGLDEFECDKTKFNLANVLMHLGELIRLGEATGSDTSLTKEYRNLISASLRNDRYRVNVVILIDTKYCNDGTFRSVFEIPNPLEIGENHFVTLNLIESTRLEEAADEVCNSFVGAM